MSHLHDRISLTQRKFTHDLLRDSGHLHDKPTVTPLPFNCKLKANEGVPLANPTLCKTYIGKLNFLTNVRPDISFAIQTLNQFMQQPTSSHITALHHLVKYVFGTSGQGILLKGVDNL